MKIILLIIAASLITTTLPAQKNKVEGWKIHHNRKEVASFKYDDAGGENRLVLLKRSLDEPGYLIITYNPISERSKWIRHFVITDSTGKELKKFDNTKELRIHNSEVARLFETREKIQVYSWALPSDPDQAAAIRVRRILLCTIYTR